jgi:hypothetical protein
MIARMLRRREFGIIDLRIPCPRDSQRRRNLFRAMAMNENPEEMGVPRQRLEKEFEDPHYHDEDEPVPSDDGDPPVMRLPSRGKAERKLPTRRHYDIDD